jgi:hypothetical protein
MAVLVTRNFRRASGALAKNTQINVTLRDSATVVDSFTTDELGFGAVYLNPGQYDFVGVNPSFRIPFDVTESEGGPAPIIFSQSVAAATWTITHNRGTKPDMVLVLDEDPLRAVYTDITYPDDNTAVVEWPTPVTGKAYIQ